jgi:hypothetical protein
MWCVPKGRIIAVEDITICQISTPFRLGGTQTTITQEGRVIATIQWNVFKKDTVTIDDRTSTVKEAFPKMKLLST